MFIRCKQMFGTGVWPTGPIYPGRFVFWCFYFLLCDDNTCLLWWWYHVL